MLLAGNKVIGCVVAARTESLICSISNLPRLRQGCPLKSGETSMLAASMTRSTVAILSLVALAACTTAQMPAAWTRTDGQPSDPAQLESAKTICRGEMEQAELVTNGKRPSADSLARTRESHAQSVYRLRGAARLCGCSVIGLSFQKLNIAKPIRKFAERLHPRHWPIRIARAIFLTARPSRVLALNDSIALQIGSTRV